MQNLVRALSLAFTLGVSSLVGGSITFSGSFGPTVNPFTTVTSLSAFDSSLGTLNSITFTIAGQSSGSVTVDNQSTQNGNYDITISALLKLVNASNSVLVSIQPIFTDPAFFVASGQTATDSGTSAAISNSATIFSGFAPYIGPAGHPGTINFQVQSTGQFQAIGNTPSTVGATTSGLGTDSVTYNYTAGPTVPEPTTMTLLGSALIGLGFLGRKRFKDR